MLGWGHGGGEEEAKLRIVDNDESCSRLLLALGTGVEGFNVKATEHECYC